MTNAGGNAKSRAMRLNKPLVRLPISFAPEVLQEEVCALPASSWVPHATGFPGNEAVRLVTVGGAATDAFEGAMRPTQDLLRCPYVMQIMAELAGVWGRSRFMGLAAGAEVPAHVDVHYYWRTHLRIHIPVITNSGVGFSCGEDTVHMAPGECWVFDSFRWHEVHNRGRERRVHLVLDTVPTERLWDLVQSAQSGNSEPSTLAPGTSKPEPLMFENLNAPKIMSPWEIRCHVAAIAEHVRPGADLDSLLLRLDRFADSWAALWAHFGTADQGIPAYGRLLTNAAQELKPAADAVQLDNELSFFTALEQSVFAMAIHPRAQAQLGLQPREQRLAS